MYEADIRRRVRMSGCWNFDGWNCGRYNNKKVLTGTLVLGFAPFGVVLNRWGIIMLENIMF